MTLDLAWAPCSAAVGSRVTNPTHAEPSRRYRAAYEAAWSRLSLVYDTTDTGNMTAQKRPAVQSIWLGGWNSTLGRIP